MRPVPYVDGWLGGAQEITVIPRQRFPFIENPTPDVYTRKNERDFRVVPRFYAPTIATRTSWTNLLTYSEDFTNASWTKTNGTASITSTASPDGRGVWGKLLETTANAEHSVAHAATVAAAAHEVTVFAMGGLGRDWIKVTFTDSAAAAFSAFFQIGSGIVGTTAGSTSAEIFPMGGGVFRCVLRFTPAAGAGTLKINAASGASTISYTGDAAKGVFLWGAQVAAGAGAPYVSTTTATRTIIAPNRDEDDPFSFLASESEPRNANSEEALVTRIFSRVPLTQVVPSSIRLAKPSITGTLPQQIGSYLVNQPDTAQQAFDAYLRQYLSNDSGSAAGVGGVLTGGTYTLSFDGGTTAPIAFDANAAAVQAALNAVSEVANRGGVIVSGDYEAGFLITFATIPAISVTSSLTVTAGSVSSSIGYVNNGFIANIQFNPSGGVINGGSFTITIGGQTTGAIAYNASVGTAQSAINALSGVSNRGGVTAAATPDPILYGPGQIQLGFAYSYPAFTASLASTLPASSTATITRLDPYSFNGLTGFHGRQQSLVFSGATVGTRTLTTPTPHGITIADDIYVKIGEAWFFVAAGNFTVPTTTTIELSVAAAAPAIAEGQATEVGKRVRQNYEPGTVTVRCVRTSYFYLPGVTIGITTADDIVPPTYEGDANTMLQLIFGAVGTINYEVGELSQWLGPILSLGVVTIKASDL